MERLPLFTRALLGRPRKGLPARYDVRWEPGLTVPAADGTPLAADHYAPVTDEPCPALLVRSPYGRGFPFGYLYGALFAEQGFHVLVQSTHGGLSWAREPADGQAAVAWLRRQPWFTGEFGTVGPSYLGYVQWALALDPPPGWRAAVIQVGAGDPYDFFWGEHPFGLERALVGGLARHQGRGALTYGRAILRMRRHLRHAERAVPLLDSYPAALGGRYPAFEEWLTHPERDDPYWADKDVTAAADHLDVPVALTAGWHDILLDQVLGQYARLRAAGHEPGLLIGPWTHTSALDRGWPQVFDQALRTLRGEATGVRVHVGGADEWRDLPHWPPAAHERALRLIEAPASFRYDPADPTPSIGGQLQSATQGARDNRRLERRGDVLTFDTAPLTEAVEVIGPVRARMRADTTAVSGDLFARLCDVDGAGRSVNVTDGIARITAGTTVVPMSAAAHRFRPGHRIRLQVSGGAHPRFLRNYGTGEPVATATRMVATTTTVHPESVLLLPVV